MSPNAPLTDAQRNAVAEMRTAIGSMVASMSQGVSESVEVRARRPAPGTLPADVTVRIEIAPPSPQPHPLLDGPVLKAPERVPIYFYALRDGRDDSQPESASELANAHVIFFIHGGGNITGHPMQEEFVQLYARILRAVASHSADSAAAATITPSTKCVLIAPSYRLATVPENVFPAALQDLVAAYDYVLGKGYIAANVVVAGDSAGGNHAIALTHLVAQSGKPAPKGVLTLAPAAIQAFDPANTPHREDILDVSVYEAMSAAYVGDSGVSRTDPLVSGAFIPFGPSWPRTLILVGTTDYLIDASRKVAERIKALDRPVELVEYDQRPHGWWIMPQIFPENDSDAMERIARFVLS